MIFPNLFPTPTLPPNTILTVFVEQAPEKNWDQPWQDACEEAALLTVVYQKQKLLPKQAQIVSDLKSIFNFEQKKSWGHDINMSQLAILAQEKYGYQTKIINNPTLPILKKYLDQKLPIIVPANGKVLYRENKNFRGGGPYYHSLVILGYDDKTKKFIVHDVGTKKGAYFRYSYSILLSAIRDWPKSGNKKDISQGEKNVLILL